jgi:hypothetical protein
MVNGSRRMARGGSEKTVRKSGQVRVSGQFLGRIKGINKWGRLHRSIYPMSLALNMASAPTLTLKRQTRLRRAWEVKSFSTLM